MENNNSTGNVEQKKWMISRIDLYHKLMGDDIRSSQNTYENTGNKMIQKIKGIRNGIFSVLGVALTVILNLNGSETGLENFYVFLSIITGIFVATYFIFYLILSFISRGLELLNYLANEQNSQISFSQGFVSTHFFNLNEITEEQIENYMNFTKLLGVAVIVNFALEIENYKDIKISWLQKSLTPELEIAKKIGKEGQEFYNKLNLKHDLPLQNSEFIKKALENYVKFDSKELK